MEAVRNVHGRLDGEIIFGIDGKGLMDDSSAIPFTKTFRVLNSGKSADGILFWTCTSSNVDRATDVIKFYGHSLGEADYSYFQALFDGVDIYESHTKLIFYYRPWKQGDGTKVTDQKARICISGKVTKLMTAYGATLDNKDHGENLLHKMLLEGRLIIKQI